MGPETEYGLVPLTHGRVAVVDWDDYGHVTKYRWHLTNTGYADTMHGRRAGSKVPIMHRLIAQTPSGMDTDHMTGNRLDNRKFNLRICTHAQNCRNSGPRENRGPKGVSWNRALKLWVARVTFEGKQYCKYFHSPEQATVWRVEKCRELHGEFARPE